MRVLRANGGFVLNVEALVGLKSTLAKRVFHRRRSVTESWDSTDVGPRTDRLPQQLVRVALQVT